MRRHLLSMVACVLAATCDARGYEVIDSRLVARTRSGDIHWIDDDKVLLIGANPADYVTPVPGVNERRFRLRIWTPKQKTVTDRHNADIANGFLCFYDGYVRFEYTSDFQRRPVDQRWRVFEGRLGQEKLRELNATDIEHRRNHVVEVNADALDRIPGAGCSLSEFICIQDNDRGCRVLYTVDSAYRITGWRYLGNPEDCWRAHDSSRW